MNRLLVAAAGAGAAVAAVVAATTSSSSPTPPAAPGLAPVKRSTPIRWPRSQNATSYKVIVGTSTVKTVTPNPAALIVTTSVAVVCGAARKITVRAANVNGQLSAPSKPLWVRC